MKCELCRKEFKNLSLHLKKQHKMSDIDIKEYYDNYLKLNIEGKCLICGKETEFNGINFGYDKYCSKECRNKALTIQNKKNLNNKEEMLKQENLLDKIKRIDNHQEELRSRTNKQKETCKICGKSFFGLGYHIAQSHKMTAKEYYDKYLKKENEGKCIVCGKDTEFNTIETGYKDTCSAKCNAINQYRIEKSKNTLFKNYGVENTFESEEIREKAKKTNIKKYGTIHPSRNKEIQCKTRATNLEKYGVVVSSQSQLVKDKAKENNLIKYGVEYPSQLEAIKEKTKETNIKKYGGVAPVFSEDVQNKIKETNLEKYNCEHPMQNENIKKKMRDTLEKQKKEIENNGYIQVKDLIEIYGQGWYKAGIVNDYFLNKDNKSYLSVFLIPKIEEYNNLQKTTSLFEREVREYISSIYNGTIIYNDRQEIKPLELDIYLPDIKVAIECNGNYTHSINFGKDKNYHLIKTEKANEKNIRLIHITEWEWNNKRNICESIINSALGIYKERIYARKCNVKEVDIKEARLFLEENHIQGYVNSSIKLGLYYNNDLVQVITLGKSRFQKDEYELLRMCTKLNMQVIGGFSKLMKHLPEDIKEVVSYVDRSKFTGKGYISSGWELIGETEPGYSYYKNGERFSRQKCQKHKLKEFLGKDNYNERLTETENMLKNSYLKVYDCGNLKMKFEVRSKEEVVIKNVE